jgi:hypothetical protein
LCCFTFIFMGFFFFSFLFFKFFLLNFIINFFFPFMVVLCGGTLWHLQRHLQCINCIILEFTPSTSALYPPPHSWNS